MEKTQDIQRGTQVVVRRTEDEILVVCHAFENPAERIEIDIPCGFAVKDEFYNEGISVKDGKLYIGNMKLFTAEAVRLIKTKKEDKMYTKHKWKSDTHFNFKYTKYLPKDYDETKKYPLVFFLHGAGERGDDLDVASRHGYMKYVRKEGKEYPFIFVAPQCPCGKYWGCYTESLLAFLDYICENLPVDKERVYLTGLSMGGTGTWMLAMAAPEKFAAIAPVCGSGIYWNGEILVNMPVYMYHGDCDEIVPITESINMLKAINKCGGKARLKICYGVGHNAWDIAYDGDELMNWMLEQRGV